MINRNLTSLFLERSKEYWKMSTDDVVSLLVQPGGLTGGFVWAKTPEGFQFWNDTLNDSNNYSYILCFLKEIEATKNRPFIRLNAIKFLE